MSPIRALLFDWDGVLAHSDEERAYGELEARYGLPPGSIGPTLGEKQRYEAYLIGRISPQEYWAEASNALEDRVPPEVLRQAWAAAQQPDEAMLALVRRLRRRYRVGLLINQPASFQEEVLQDRLHLDDLFSAVITSGLVGVAKPYPGIYHFALERIFVERQECVFVDDEERHCTAARSQRMVPILYRGYEALVAELEGLGVYI